MAKHSEIAIPVDNIIYVNGDLYSTDTTTTSSSKPPLDSTGDEFTVSSKPPEECQLLAHRHPPQDNEKKFNLRSRSKHVPQATEAPEKCGSCNNQRKRMIGSTLSNLSKDSSCSVTGSRYKRLVSKEGIVDIKYINVPGINQRYLTDIFHTLIDAKWRYISVLFTLSFIVSWLVFGTSWYVIVKLNTTDKKCIDNVNDWISAFLFSIETQTTIGFGGRAVTSSCPEGVLLLVIQTIVGMFINCAMLGLLFVKLSRPKNRGKATLFSNKAIITIREGSYCLMFRYVDFRPRRLLDSNIRLLMVRQSLTEEGEFVPLDMADMKVTLDFMQNEYTLRVFPLFPLTIMHEIDEDSPLYEMSRYQLESAEFEIIVILEGTVPTTGSTTQALTSYRPDEILWGHRFTPIMSGFNFSQPINRFDLSTLHDTHEDKYVPVSSAEEYSTKSKEDCSSCSSCSGSNGYQSGTRSIYSFSHQDLNKVTSSPSTDDYDVVVNIDSTRMQHVAEMKESEA